MATEAYRASYSMANLEQLTDQQLDLLLNGARAFNDIVMLQRLAAARERQASKSDTYEREAQITLLFMTLMLLAGKLWEAWEVIDRSAQLWKSGGRIFPSSANQMRRKITKRFNKKSILYSIRNRHAFHYDKQTAVEGIRACPADVKAMDLPAIAGETHSVTLFLFAEYVAAESLLRELFPAADRSGAMQRLFSEIIDAAADVGDLFNEIIPSLLHSGPSLSSDVVESNVIDMEARPHIDETFVPFLVRTGS